MLFMSSFLRLANKQDIEGAMDQEEIIDALKLEELANEFKSPCRVVSFRASLKAVTDRHSRLVML